MKEFRVNTHTEGSQRWPSVSALNNIIVYTWTSANQDGSFSGIYSKIYHLNGTVAVDEFRVNTHTQNNQAYSSVATKNDLIIYSWTSDFQDGSFSGIYSKIYYLNGTVAVDEFRVNTHTQNNQADSSVATTNNSIIYSWTSDFQDGSFSGIYSKIYHLNGTVAVDEFRVNTHTQNNQADSSVATTNNSIIYSWTSDFQDGSFSGIYSKIYNFNGTVAVEEFRVNTHTQNNQGWSSISAYNNIIVYAWTSAFQDGSVDGIYGKIYYLNGIVAVDEFRVNTHTQNNQADSSVAINSELISYSWTSAYQDGSADGIYGKIYYLNGTVAVDEFRVNTYTIGNQIDSSVAAIDDILIFCWSSANQDGSGYGVYSQIFFNNGTKYPYEEVTTTVAPTTLLVTTVVPTTTTTTTTTTPAPPPPSTTTTTEIPTTTTLSPDTTAAPTTLIPPTAPVGVSSSSDAFNVQMDNSIFVSGIVLCGVIMGEFLL